VACEAAELDPAESVKPPGADVLAGWGALLRGDLCSTAIRAASSQCACWLPDGFPIAPHDHSQPEIVTVISGIFRIVIGEEANPDDAAALEPGGSFAAYL
jgi:hypothetical protein